MYMHAGYFSNPRQPELSSLIEASVGARVEDEGAGHALDVETAEDAVVALQGLLEAVVVRKGGRGSKKGLRHDTRRTIHNVSFGASFTRDVARTLNPCAGTPEPPVVNCRRRARCPSSSVCSTTSQNQRITRCRSPKRAYSPRYSVCRRQSATSIAMCVRGWSVVWSWLCVRHGQQPPTTY